MGGARLWPNAPAAAPQGVLEFVRLQQASHRGVKAADPAVTVVLPALTPTGLGECWLDPGGQGTQRSAVEQVQKAIDDVLYLDFLYRVNSGEIKQYYDVLGVHPGGYSNPPDDFLDRKTVASTTLQGPAASTSGATTSYGWRCSSSTGTRSRCGSPRWAGRPPRGPSPATSSGGTTRRAPGGSTSPACWSRSPPRPPT